MKIKDFIEGRNVEKQAINRYISRHPELFTGHTKMVGKEMDLDDEAIRILDKQYPYPEPIQIVEDTESRRQLLLAQQQIIQLQQQMIKLAEKAALVEAQTLLIEDREGKIEQLQSEIEKHENEEKNLINQVHEREQEIERLRSRKLIERILNK